MKKSLFTLLFFGCTILINAQNTPNVGDELIISETHNGNFKHVKFPKPNILIKRGNVTNYKSVYGNRVVIDQIITKGNGTTHVQLKRKDGKKFFGFLTTVKAQYAKALEAKEIVLVK